MIISASRRTDIPAFHMDEFMRRIREGVLYVRNPMNERSVRRVPLSPDVTDLIVFWTKNAKPLLRYTDELTQLGYRFIVHYTLTGYGAIIEKNVPPLERSLETLALLVSEIGARRVVWRYDPIAVSKEIDHAWHEKNFSYIARCLSGRVLRCMTGFLECYKSVAENIRLFGLRMPNEKECEALMKTLSHAARSEDIELSFCTNRGTYAAAGVQNAACIDGAYIERAFGVRLDLKKDSGQRKECQCLQSVDAGEYGTCANGCVYCYASGARKTVQGTNGAGSFLLREGDCITDYNASSHITPQKDLFD